jgi:hypothetical protein
MIHNSYFSKFYLESLKGKDYLGDLGVDGRITLKLVLIIRM